TRSRLPEGPPTARRWLRWSRSLPNVGSNSSSSRRRGQLHRSGTMPRTPPQRAGWSAGMPPLVARQAAVSRSCRSARSARRVDALFAAGAAPARTHLEESALGWDARLGLMERWTLQSSAWQHAVDALACEAIATSDSASLAKALATAYDAGYRGETRAHGILQLEHDAGPSCAHPRWLWAGA